MQNLKVPDSTINILGRISTHLKPPSTAGWWPWACWYLQAAGAASQEGAGVGFPAALVLSQAPKSMRSRTGVVHLLGPSARATRANDEQAKRGITHTSEPTSAMATSQSRSS